MTEKTEAKHISPYAKVFDENSRMWTKQSKYNLVFLREKQKYLNDVLVSRGHVFLNEVYDLLDIERTQVGQLVGWAKTNGVVKYPINFDITEDPNTGVILLDFNVDGIIYYSI